MRCDSSLLGAAFYTILPVLRQFFMSHYIFIFQLPKPLPAIYGRIGNFWFLHKAHSHASSSQQPPFSTPESASAFASSLGPSIGNCETQTGDGSTYGPSVRARARRNDGGFPDKIRLYREGLIDRHWSNSPLTVASLNSLETSSRMLLSKGHRSNLGFGGSEFEGRLTGTLKAPCTVIWGAKDPVLDQQICLEGMGAYLDVEGSQVILLPEGGHWVLTEPNGRRVMRACLLWSLHGKGTNLKDRIQALDIDARFLVNQ